MCFLWSILYFQTHRQNVQHRTKKIKQLKRQAAKKAEENANIEQQLSNMQVTVAERRHIYEAIGNITISALLKQTADFRACSVSYCGLLGLQLQRKIRQLNEKSATGKLWRRTWRTLPGHRQRTWLSSGQKSSVWGWRTFLHLIGWNTNEQSRLFNR